MKMYQRGDVVYIHLPKIEGSHVQGGMRPCVIVQNNVGNRYSPTTLVVPLTTTMKRLDMPTNIPVCWGTLRPGVAECSQVRVVDVSDDWQYVTTLPQEIMVHVDQGLRNAFFYGEGGCKRCCIRLVRIM